MVMPKHQIYTQFILLMGKGVVVVVGVVVDVVVVGVVVGVVVEVDGMMFHGR